MSYRIEDDENRIQDIKDQIDELEVQTFSPEVVARNESTRNTGIQTGDGAATNPYPEWYPVRDFGTLGLLTIDVVLNRVDSHVAKMTLNGDVDFAFTLPPPANKAMWFILDVTIDAIGGYTINLPPNVFPASIAIDNAANARSILRFTTTDGGVTYFVEDLQNIGGGGISFPLQLPLEDFGAVGGANIVLLPNNPTGNAKVVTLTGDIGLQITGGPPVATSQFMYLTLIQDAIGGHSISTVDSAVQNGGQMDSVLDKSASQITSYMFYTTDGGITWLVEDINIGSGGAGGEFFGPWTGAHDAGNQTLNDLATLGIVDVAGSAHGLLQGIAATGVRLTLTSGEQFSIFDNITEIFKINTSNGLELDNLSIRGLNTIFFNEPSHEIISDNIGFLYSLPANRVHDWSIDGTRMLLSETSLNIAVPVTLTVNGITFTTGNITMGTGNIIAGGSGEGMTNIGHLDFIDNLATPASTLSLYSDGTDMLVNTGGIVVNLSNVGNGEFLDSTFRILGSGDQTKKLAFEIDTFSSGFTRTFQFPNADGTVFVTPAQQDLNLNTLDIFNIDSLAFQASPGTLSSVNVGFSSLGNGGFRANVLNNGDFQITEENVLHFAFDGGTNSIIVSDSLFNILETAGSTAFSIAKLNGSTNINEPTILNLQIGATSIVTLDSFGLNLNSKVLFNVNQIGFTLIGNFIEDDLNGMIFKTPVGDDFTWSNGTTTFATLDIDGLFLNQLFLQFTSIASPGPTGSSNVGELFMDSGNLDHLSIIRNGSVIDLEAGGGGEVNTGSNVGSGLGKVFKTKVGVDLQFKSILAGSGISIVNATDDVQINANSDGNQDATPFVDPTSGNPLVTEDVYMSNSKQGLEISLSTTATEDTMVYVPIYIGRTTNIDRLAWVKADPASIGSITWTIGIYDSVNVAPNVGANYPGDLIVSGSTTSTSTEGIKFIGISPTTFSPGLYWLGFLITNISTATTLVTVARHETANANCVGYFILSTANDRLNNILSFLDDTTFVPSSAPPDMAIVGENPIALFYRVNTVF